ncbi:MAG TPA: hypothetical protein PKD85_05985 [Saprospiraceae bacterium]|nr:hypothetical protein [Saprospiraceae bacterium]
MTVKELKEVIRSKKKKDLEEIVLVLYKNLPKKVITENGIDQIIMMQAAEPSKINTDQKDMALLKELTIFTQNLYEGNYGVPNRIIPKNKRSKWRFEAMNYYKEVVKSFPQSKIKKELADAFGQLYSILCYGCNYYIVSSTDTFGSIQKNQVSFFRQVIEFKKEVYIGKELYDHIWNHLTYIGLSYDTLQSELYAVVAESFESPEAIESLIEIGKQFLQKEIEKLKLEQKKNKYASTYDVEKIITGIAILMLKINDYEAVKSIYNNHKYVFSDNEIMYYVMVKTYLHYGYHPNTKILEILNEALIQKIKLRDSLQKLHAQLTGNIDTKKEEIRL